MIEIKAAGYFKLEAVRIENGVEKRRVLADWFPNLITDSGLDQMGQVSVFGNLDPTTDIIAQCRVGSGNTVPAFTDVGLVDEVARSNAILTTESGIVAGPPRYGWRRRVFRFNAGVAAGNLSEIGVGRSATQLFSRALIVDSNGNPTTITILPTEFLDVTYEVRLYIPTGDVASQVLIDTTTYDVVMRVAENDNPGYWADYIPNINCGSNNNWYSSYYYSGGLAGESLTPTGQLGSTVYMTIAAYTTGSHYRDRTAYLDINQSNGDIRTVVIFSGMGQYQFQFTPAIPKTNEKTLSLTFRLHFGRYAP